MDSIQLTNASHHDITARENGKTLQAQVSDLRNSIQTFAAGTGAQILSESAIIQTRLGQAADKLARNQESLHMNVRAIRDNMCGQILRSGDTSVRALGMIRGDIRRTSLIHRRSQLGMNRQLRKLNQGQSQLASMLTKLSSLHLESPRADAPDVAHYSGLENMAFLLIQIQKSINQLIFGLQSSTSMKISDGEVVFFLEELERLVTFCDRSPHTISATYATHYSIGIERRPLPKTMQRRYRRRMSHQSTLGCLEVQFEEIIGDFNDLPTTVQCASFHFVPSTDVYSTGIYASFRRDLRMAHRPYIVRSLREIRVVPHSVTWQVVEALHADDLPAVQRMLATGQIKPWDSFINANLLEVPRPSLRGSVRSANRMCGSDSGITSVFRCEQTAYPM